jgi:hypothetical protein
MALQDYGSFSYTMHHHNQLGKYTVCSVCCLVSGQQWKLTLKNTKLSRVDLHSSQQVKELNLTISVVERCRSGTFSKGVLSYFAYFIGVNSYLLQID